MFNQIVLGMGTEYPWVCLLFSRGGFSLSWSQVDGAPAGGGQGEEGRLLTFAAAPHTNTARPEGQYSAGLVNNGPLNPYTGSQQPTRQTRGSVYTCTLAWTLALIVVTIAGRINSGHSQYRDQTRALTVKVSIF